MLTAITRRVNPLLAACELEFHPRVAIDAALAAEQHRRYELTLESLGVRVVSLPTLPDQPDCVFVEDPALVLDEVVVITRMGATARRGESSSLAAALTQYRSVVYMSEPATLDGGDVVRIGKTLYVGQSRRTNAEGARQLEHFVAPFGYRVIRVPVTGCLHLKSACCSVGDDALLANRAWFDVDAFSGCQILDVPDDEPGAADVLRIKGVVLVPASFPRTRQLLESAGHRVRDVDVSELQKAEAGVTCMSLVFEAR